MTYFRKFGLLQGVSKALFHGTSQRLRRGGRKAFYTGKHGLGMIKPGDGVLPGTCSIRISDAMGEDASVVSKDGEEESCSSRIMLINPAYSGSGFPLVSGPHQVMRIPRTKVMLIAAPAYRIGSAASWKTRLVSNARPAGPVAAMNRPIL